MSTPTAGRSSSISHLLRATKKLLQGVTFDARAAATLYEGELDVLERDAFDILQLIRSWRNRLAPIHRIPPEILALVPDFWDVEGRDENVIAVTHVCRAWREVFVSRPTLWTDLGCVDLDKTRAYLERSESSPITLTLNSNYANLSDPFFEFISGVTGRLKSLEIDVNQDDLRLIGVYLSRQAPLLEVLSMHSYYDPELPSTLFNGDLSSLRKLRLLHVWTQLPWRNMINLTSLTMTYELLPVSANQLLDFFAGAPYLREIEIHSTTQISGDWDGRLVPLTYLQRMDTGIRPSCLLFDHLLIPVGARLRMAVDLPSPPIEGRPPRFIDNLKNLPDFTAIELDSGMSRILFSGPNGEVDMVPRDAMMCSLLQSLVHFDTSRTVRLEIKDGEYPSNGPLYRALLPMEGLQTLKLDQCEDAHIFVQALHPSISSSGVVVCPKLEELVIEHRGMFDIKNVVWTAAARALRGAKLKTVRIVTWDDTEFPLADVLELEKHVLHVEWGHGW